MKKSAPMPGIIDQIITVCQPRHRIALILGTLLGGFVPVATYIIAHFEAQQSPLKWILVGGGLVYSAITVFTWGRAAFQYAAKAIGFVILVEGVAITATTPAISAGALLILVLINGFGTATTLIIERRVSRKSKREANALSRLMIRSQPGVPPQRSPARAGRRGVFDSQPAVITP